MKLLKKTLCLVLVVVMTVGMMAVAASAANYDSYADANATAASKYAEAMDVAMGLGIIKGVEGNAVAIDGTLNRAQAAKIICYLMLGETAAEALASGNTIFSDVAADHWANKYISYAASQGILVGNDGKFNPNAPVTGYALAKMLLNARGIGYITRQVVENGEIVDVTRNNYEGGYWTTNITMDNTKHAVNLFAGLADVDLNKALTRGQAMQMAVNAMLYNGGVVAGFDYLPFYATYAVKKNADSGVDTFGRPQYNYTVGTGENTKVIATLNYAPTFTYASNFTAAAKKAVEDARYTLADASTTVDYYYNGALTTGSGDVADINTVAELYLSTSAINGLEIELYDIDGDKVIDDVVVFEAYFASVSKVTPAAGNTPASVTVTIQAPAGTDSIKVVDDATKTTDMFNTISAYAEQYVVVYPKCQWEKDENAAKGAQFIIDVKPVTSVYGNISRAIIDTTNDYKATTKVVINGTTYAVNSTFAGMTRGQLQTATAKKGTFYVAPNGCLIGYVGDAPEATVDYAVMVTEQYDAIISGKFVHVVVGLVSDGTVKEFILKTGTVTDGDVYTYDTGADGLTTFTLVENTTDVEDGGVVKVASDNIDATTLTAVAGSGNVTLYFKADMKVITWSNNAATVYTGKQAVNAKDCYYVVSEDANHNFYVEAVYVDGGLYVATTSTASDLYFVTKLIGTDHILAGSPATSTPLYTYEAYVNGVKVTFESFDDLQSGDFNKFYKPVITTATGYYTVTGTAVTATGGPAIACDVILNGSVDSYNAGIVSIDSNAYYCSAEVVKSLVTGNTTLTDGDTVSAVVNEITQTVIALYIVPTLS